MLLEAEIIDSVFYVCHLGYNFIFSWLHPPFSQIPNGHWPPQRLVFARGIFQVSSILQEEVQKISSISGITAGQLRTQGRRD